MKKVILLLTIFVLAGCSQQAPTGEKQGQDASPTLKTEDQMGEVRTAELKDVTKGVTINGMVNTKGFAEGTASLENDDTNSKLTADFGMLPELSEEYDYEGWLVQSEPLNYLSTGKAEAGASSGLWINEFSTTENTNSYDSYIVTLEADDDTTPEDELLRGEFN